ncbi:hypothetical protein ABS642_05125 [Microbacterium sp. A8/3-1]|uniref:Uncharacterized protein n=1 Tax=Microbacterium sp. A8/3-1 TaxID=3160749 RepID=A0AAU7VZA3_9MICO
MTAITFVLLLVLSPFIAIVLFAVFAAVFGAVFLSGGLTTVGIGGLVSRVRSRAGIERTESRVSGDEALSVLTGVTRLR